MSQKNSQEGSEKEVKLWEKEGWKREKKEGLRVPSNLRDARKKTQKRKTWGESDAALSGSRGGAGAHRGGDVAGPRGDSPRTRFSGSLMLTVWSWEADKELLMDRSAVGPSGGSAKETASCIRATFRAAALAIRRGASAERSRGQGHRGALRGGGLTRSPENEHASTWGCPWTRLLNPTCPPYGRAQSLAKGSNLVGSLVPNRPQENVQAQGQTLRNTTTQTPQKKPLAGTGNDS